MKKDYTKIGIASVLFIFFVFLIVQIVEFSGRERGARSTYDAAKSEFDRVSADQRQLQEDFTYYSNPANLTKEARARFNYTLPGEKTLILIPPEGSSTVSD